MLPIEFENALKDWQEVEFNTLKTDYERTRMSIYFQLMSQTSKSISYKEFCKESVPFEWDTDTDVPVNQITDSDYTMMQNLGSLNNKIKDLSLDDMNEITGL